MNVDIVKLKLKCICCRKIIPESKIFIIVKENDNLRHMCRNCFLYVSSFHLLEA